MRLFPFHTKLLINANVVEKVMKQEKESRKTDRRIIQVEG